MKNYYKLFVAIMTVCLMTAGSLSAQYVRLGNIPVESTDPGGFGNFIAGVDLDKDGMPEIYAVNNNVADSPDEMIPRIYKYEFTGTGWTLVWFAVLDVPRQNTWPCLAIGDLDNDSKPEVIWGPVNNLDAATNPNPARVIVFEVKGDGSDELGVPDGFGGFKPNAKWTMTDLQNYEIRPFRWHISDIDSDGKQEIIFADRQANLNYGVMSVSNIPDNGDGSETWTMEMSGLTVPTTDKGVEYDVATIGNKIYLFSTSGAIEQLTYANGGYTLKMYPATSMPGGSWKSASVVDLNNDGKKEIVVAGFTVGNQKVWLIQEEADTIKSITEIANLGSTLSATGRIMGGTAGDLDGNGKLDFIFGNRDAVPNAQIVRLEYLGGDIATPANYAISVLDNALLAKGGRWDELAIANVDEDVDMEVLYSSGYTTDDLAPIQILDPTGKLPVELKSFSASVASGAVELNWATATELNNRGFEIQRKSAAGFISIAFIDGKGTTSEAHSYKFVDNGAAFGKNIYRLKQVNFDGTFEYSNEAEVNFTTPSKFALDQNYPNPFNPATTITYSLAAPSKVTLSVYNMLGEEVAVLVRGQLLDQGTHSVRFDASTLPSGAYVYRLQAGDMVISKKMTLTK